MKNALNRKLKLKSRILVVDDDLDFSNLLAAGLRSHFDAEVVHVSSAYTAMNELLDSYYDLVVLDWNLAGSNGVKALTLVDEAMGLENNLPLRGASSKIPVVLLSAYDSETIKPFNREKKHFQVRSVLSKRQKMSDICHLMSRLFESPIQKAV